jgi:hypothetical protein
MAYVGLEHSLFYSSQQCLYGPPFAELRPIIRLNCMHGQWRAWQRGAESIEAVHLVPGPWMQVPGRTFEVAGL